MVHYAAQPAADLCKRIREAADCNKLTPPIAELTRLLQAEQDAIQARIDENVYGNEFGKSRRVQ